METIDLGRFAGDYVVMVRPFDDMVAYAAMVPEKEGEPDALEAEGLGWVLRPHSDAFPDVSVPLCVMDYPTLIRTIHDCISKHAEFVTKKS